MDAMNTLNKCDKCNQGIHPNFIGYHKCGYSNCPICKNAIITSGYWYHVRSHPGHENDNPPPPRTSFESRQQQQNMGSTYHGGSRSKESLNRGSIDAAQLKVGKEYEVNITEIGRHGDGVARIQGCMVFVKGGHIGEQTKIMITETRNRFAVARTA